MAPEKNLSPDQTPPLETGSPTLEYSDGKLRVKLPASGALVRSAEGLAAATGDGMAIEDNALAISLKTVSGLEFEAGKLTILLKNAGAIQVDASGLAIKITATGGLQSDTYGAAIKISSTGGMQTDSAGLSIKHKTAGGTDSDNDGLFVKTVTITEKGACPTLPNNATNFLNGVGNWAIPPGSPLSDSNPQDVKDAPDPGEGTSASRDDHVHELALTADAGLGWTGTTLGVSLDTLGGITSSSDGLAIQLDDPESGLIVGSGGLAMKVGAGLDVDSSGYLIVQADGTRGLAVDSSGAFVKIDSSTVTFDSGGSLTAVSSIAIDKTMQTDGSTPPNYGVKLASGYTSSTAIISVDSSAGLFIPIGNSFGLTGGYEDIRINLTGSNPGLQFASDGGIAVLDGDGIIVDSSGITVQPYNGITVDSNGVSVVASDGITVDGDGVAVLADNGISVGTYGVSVEAYNGITVDSDGVSVTASDGISVGASGVTVVASDGISVGTGGVTLISAASGSLGGVTPDSDSSHYLDGTGSWTSVGGGGSPGTSSVFITTTSGSVGSSGSFICDDTKPGLTIVGSDDSGTPESFGTLQFTTSAGGLQLKMKASGGLTVDSDGVYVVWQAG